MFLCEQNILNRNVQSIFLTTWKHVIIRLFKTLQICLEECYAGRSTSRIFHPIRITSLAMRHKGSSAKVIIWDLYVYTTAFPVLIVFAPSVCFQLKSILESMTRCSITWGLFGYPLSTSKRWINSSVNVGFFFLPSPSFCISDIIKYCIAFSENHGVEFFFSLCI